ncbi:unnamed protein product [Trifolium pratense]|uniref:Uncharacterized protein n=2 Tax=Trifolium pratense TaxID=57577 RepID=A0ACB0L369_TRIPR|nr:unnamed protein product [Trifolium pratense]CAJ2663013.1 unnamed protein product [Trifolium pratense]
MAYELVFRRNSNQAQTYEILRRREIQATRYADESILRKLGLLESVNYLLDNLNLRHFLSQHNPVYPKLTLEFLSSLIVNPVPETRSSLGTIYFRMFNVEYEFSFNDMADLLRFPHGNGVKCEVSDDEQWKNTFSLFWRAIADQQIDSHEGNAASSIHNPALRYFRHLLANTIFGRANFSKVNSKELFYMFAVFKELRINTAPFFFSHMLSQVNSRRNGVIIFGGLITTIAKAIGLGPRLENLDHTPPRFINEDMVKSMNLVRLREDGRYDLMINNRVFSNITLPNTWLTDVRNERNLRYTNNSVPNRAPTHISPNVAAGGGASIVPPAHTTHFSNTFAGSSSSSRQSSIDDVLHEIRAQNALNQERDGLFYAMHQQQEEMMERMTFMQAQQDEILQNQHEMQGYYHRWESSEEHRQQQLDNVIQELGGLRLQFNNFQNYQHPPS